MSLGRESSAGWLTMFPFRTYITDWSVSYSPPPICATPVAPLVLLVVADLE
jgi:hypothetical protein